MCAHAHMPPPNPVAPRSPDGEAEQLGGLWLDPARSIPCSLHHQPPGITMHSLGLGRSHSSKTHPGSHTQVPKPQPWPPFLACRAPSQLIPISGRSGAQTPPSLHFYLAGAQLGTAGSSCQIQNFSFNLNQWLGSPDGLQNLGLTVPANLGHMVTLVLTHRTLLLMYYYVHQLTGTLIGQDMLLVTATLCMGKDAVCPIRKKIDRDESEQNT